MSDFSRNNEPPTEPDPPPPPRPGGMADPMPRRQPQNSGDLYELSDPHAAPALPTPVEPPTPRDAAPAYELSSRRRPDPDPPARRPDPSPRVLILVWILWLLGSWGASFSVDRDGPVHRWMILAAAVGLTVLWPALRLSQQGPDHDDAPRSIMARVLLDWLSLNLVMQTVIWPLHMIGSWDFSQTLWLSGALASWSLLSGSLIVAGCRTHHTARRLLAMLLAVALLLGEPLAMWLVNLGRSADNFIIWTMRICPLPMLWHMTERGSAWQAQPWTGHVMLAAAAALAAWLLLAIFAPVQRHRG